MSDGPAWSGERVSSFRGPVDTTACQKERTFRRALLRLALPPLTADRARRVLALAVPSERTHRFRKVVLAEIALLVDNEVDPVGTGGEQVVLQRRRSVVGVDDVARLLMGRADPLGKLHRVRDRGRQEDVADFVRQEDDRLLPDDTTLYSAPIQSAVDFDCGDLA